MALSVVAVEIGSWRRRAAWCMDRLIGAGRLVGIGRAPPFLTGIPALPFKLNQDRRHHIPRQQRKVVNWPAYEAGLRQRGSLTVWFTEVARASRRQAKTRCGQSCQRRATSATRTPGTRLSSTIRALSSADQRRRRSGPVRSSIRRKPPFASSLTSNIITALTPIGAGKKLPSPQAADGVIWTSYPRL
jgi:hypothetical protein